MGTLHITNDTQHQEYLQEAFELMSSEAGTPKGERLALLAEAIQSYECSRYPLAEPSMNVALSFRIENAGVDQSALVPVFLALEEIDHVLDGCRSVNTKEYEASLNLIQSVQTNSRNT